ncbi:hypothetical protein ACG83_00885 [Frankia sp. R43]|nr:hypothetical protein ACG83_00885 [Frankia sp. R43]
MRRRRAGHRHDHRADLVMDVLLFLFMRRAGMTVDAFRRHYLDVHVPLAIRTSTATGRYVVRLTEDGHGPVPVDAVTEIVTPSADVFFDPDRGFTSPEDAVEVITDSLNFLAPFPIYQVRRTVLRAADRSGELEDHVPGSRSPGVTLARLELGDSGPVRPMPDPPDELVRDHLRYDVLKTIGEGPDLRSVDLVHLRPGADVDRYAADSYLLGEYVQKVR